MQNDHQAEADSQQEQQAVEDPLDASNVLDQEAEELNQYQQFVDGLEEEEQDYSASTDASEEGGYGEELSGEEESTEQDTDQEDLEEGAGEAEAQGDEAEFEEEEDSAANKTDRFRIRAKDEVEIEALSLRKRHPDWSLEECIAKAKIVLGVETESSNQQEDSDQSSQRSVAEVSDQIAQLRQQKKEAQVSLEFETVAELESQIDALIDEREVLRVAEVQQQASREQQQQESFERQFEEYETRAVQLYPDTTKADSPITKRIIALDQQMRELGDPLYYSPEKPLILAKRAAYELGIPMRDPSAQPARQPSSSKGRLIQPASGNARTTPNSSTAPKLDDTLGRIDSLEAYEDFAASL